MRETAATVKIAHHNATPKSLFDGKMAGGPVGPFFVQAYYLPYRCALRLSLTFGKFKVIWFMDLLMGRTIIIYSAIAI